MSNSTAYFSITNAVLDVFLIMVFIIIQYLLDRFEFKKSVLPVPYLN